MSIRVLIAAVTAAWLLLPNLSFSLDAPKGDVILTVTGAGLGNANVNGTAQFDLSMLEALPGRTAVMVTPWAKGKVKYSGPFLRAVLDAAGAHGERLNIAALNDYAIDVPIGDALGLDTILAIRQNGQLMAVRDKGPIFLIYPFDEDKTLYNEKYFSRSVWQIKTIEVLP